MGSNSVGGVVGSGGTVSNCYNTGGVTGSRDSVGGVVGNANTLVIKSYNIGMVNGDDNTGGVVGCRSLDCTIKNCYYLTGTASHGIGYDDMILYSGSDDDAMPLSEAEMKLQSSFVGWDFHNVWAIDNQNGYEYPQLIKFLTDGEEASIWGGATAENFARGTGTEANPYIIETAAHLAFFSLSVNNGITYSGKYIKLANDITLNRYNAKYWVLTADEWEPIGTKSEFAGNFDVGSHTISGIYIDTTKDY